MQKNIALNVLIFLYINFGKLHLKEYLVGKCFGKFSKNLQNSQKFVPAKVKIRLKGLEGKILSFLLYIFINFMEKKPQKQIFVIFWSDLMNLQSFEFDASESIPENA